MTTITIPRSVIEVALDYLTDKRVYAGAFEGDDDKIRELDDFIKRLRSFLERTEQ